MAIELTITSDAHLEGFEKTQQKLQQLGLATENLKKITKTGNFDAVATALERSYEYTAAFDGELKAAIRSAKEIKTVIQSLTPLMKKGELFTVDADGEKQKITTVKEAYEKLRTLIGKINAEAELAEKSITKKGSQFSYESFSQGLEKDSDAARMFGTELDAINMKMQKIKEQGTRMYLAGGNAEDIKRLSTEYKELAKQSEILSNATTGTTTRIKNLIKNFVSAQMIVWAIRTAFNALTKAIRESSEAASLSEQVYNKFDTVFDGLEKKAGKVADTIATQFGMAGSSAREAMASIADMFIGAGMNQSDALKKAEELTSRLTDIMSFKDIGGTIVSNAQSIMSGVFGNTENLRKFGGIIKDSMIQAELLKRGLGDLTGQQLELEKAVIRMDLFLQTQKNSIGATAREWDNMASVQRRYEEQMKQMKEMAGDKINNYFKPIKAAILELVSAWNLAAKAHDNYEKGQSNTSLYDENNALASKMSQSLNKEFAGGWGGVENSNFAKKYNPDLLINMFKGVDWSKPIADTISQIFTNKIPEGAALVSAQIADVFKTASDMVARYGAPWEVVTDKIKSYGTVSEQVIDAVVAKFQELDKAAVIVSKNEESRQNAKVFGSSIASYNTELSSLIDGGFGFGGLNEFLGRDASSYASIFDKILGVDDKSGNLDAKKKSVEDIISWANGVISTSTNETVKSLAQGVLEIASETYKNVASDIGKLQRSEKMLDISQQVADLEERNRLMEIYGDENSDIVDLLMQQKDAEREINVFLDKQVKDGLLPETELEAQKLEFAKKIAEQYGIQLDTLKEQTAEKERQKITDAKNASQRTIDAAWREYNRLGASDETVAFLDKSDKVDAFIENLQKANVLSADIAALAAQYSDILDEIAKKTKDIASDDAIASGQTAIDDAKSALSLVGASDYEKQMADVESKVNAYSETLKKSVSNQDTVNAMTDEYRKVLLDTVDAQNKYNKKLEEQTKAEKIQGAIGNAESIIKNAQTTLSLIGASDEQKQSAEVTSQVESFAATLLQAGVGFDTVYAWSQNYRQVLEETVKKQNEYNRSLKAIEAQASRVDSLASINKTISGVGVESTAKAQALDEYFELFAKMNEVSNQMLTSGSTLKDVLDYQLEMEEKINVLYGERLTDAQGSATSKAQDKIAEIGMGVGDRQTYESAQNYVKQYKQLNAPKLDPEIASSIDWDSLGTTLATAYMDLQTAVDDYKKGLVNAGAEEAFAAEKAKEMYDLGANKIMDASQFAAEQMIDAAKKVREEWWAGQGEKVYRQGDVGTIMDGVAMGGVAGGAIAWLAEFASGLEVVTTASNLLSTTLQPLIDGFLSPMMPVLEVISSILEGAMMPILQILWPVIKVLAVVFIALVTPIQMFLKALEVTVHNISNLFAPWRWRSYDEVLQVGVDNAKKMSDVMAIELSNAIATQKKLSEAQKGELEAYKQMYKNGLLTLAEYYSMISGVVGKDVAGNVSVQKFAEGTWKVPSDMFAQIHRGEIIVPATMSEEIRSGRAALASGDYNVGNTPGGGMTTYSYGNVTFIINGTNLDKDELADAVMRKMGQKNRRNTA